MFNHKLSQKFLTILGAIGLGLLITPNFVLRGQAQSDSQPTSPLNFQVASEEGQAEIEFSPPNRGKPERTAEGGSRGCKEDILLAVSPLIPNDRGGMTISEYPTFLWYLNSETQAKVKELNFGLVSHDQDAEIYIAEKLPVNQSGIVSVQIPTSQPPLENGKWYNWFLQVQLEKDGTDLSNCYVSAWIKLQVLTPEQQQELDSLTTAEERLNFYQQNEIWYDALATLDELRRENPDDPTLNEQWRQTLESIELAELADQPPAEITQIVRESEETVNP
jgi:hypothetical protein